ncbi:MAG: ice-binding family protein [Akkermansiaceae bacterium]|nr:ice-binding family protein [Akkermansiaceae bacterium]
MLLKSGITNVPSSATTGDIGKSPIAGAAMTAITQPQVTGNIYSVDAAGPAGIITGPVKLGSAVLDMEAAYTEAAGRPNPDFIELAAGDISGMTLTPSIYKWSSGVTVPTDVTFSGCSNDVWILEIAGTFTVGNGVAIHLAGGAQAKNIFWQVAGANTIGTTAHFEENLLAKTSITIQTRISINGRLFAQTAVALEMNTVTEPE